MTFRLGFQKAGSPLILLAAQPVYQYFSRRYNVKIKHLMLNQDKSSDSDFWYQLNNFSKSKTIQLMLCNYQPSDQTIKKLKMMNIKIIIFISCANTPPNGNFITVMEDNISNLKRQITN